MTIAYSTDWEIRTTGDYSNGGGFNRESGGTDYTQQDVAQLALTDCATSGVGSTTLTSATGGFTAAMVGNVINLSAGTNLTANWYEITAYTDTNTVTIDRAPDDGVGGVSGATGKVGGAMSWFPPDGNDGGPVIHYNKFWVKHGTYTLTNNTISAQNGPVLLRGVSMEGYENVRGDLGSKPLFSVGSQSPATVNQAIIYTYTQFQGLHLTNIKVDGVDSSRSWSGIVVGDYRNWVQHCEAVNCSGGFSGNNGFARFCKASNCVTGFGAFYTEFCVAHDCTTGINAYINGAVHCLAYNCTTGYYLNGGADVARCIADNCSSFGIYHYSSYGNSLENLVTNCGTGIYFRGVALSSDHNYLYNNSTDVTYGGNNPASRYVSYDSTSITSDPYTDSANGDYTINNNETGGRPYRQLLENGESIARTFYPNSLPEKQERYIRDLSGKAVFEFSIGAASHRDYANLSAFFADFDNTLIDVPASRVIVVCYNDTGNDEAVIEDVTTASGLYITNPSNCEEFILTVDDDSWHKGEFGKGCVIRASVPYYYLVNMWQNTGRCRYLIERLVIDGNGQSFSNNAQHLLYNQISATQTPFYVTFSNLLIQGSSGASYGPSSNGAYGIRSGAYSPTLINNCVVRNVFCERSGQNVSGMNLHRNSVINNCAVYNISNTVEPARAIGLRGVTAGTVKDSIVMSCGGDCVDASIATVSNVVTDDSTGTHQSTVATEFVDAPNGDFRLKPGATSVGLGPTTKAQIEDITGNRRRSVVAHDAGAFNNISGYDYDYDVAATSSIPDYTMSLFPYRLWVEDDFDDGTGPVAHPLRGN